MQEIGLAVQVFSEPMMKVPLTEFDDVLVMICMHVHVLLQVSSACLLFCYGVLSSCE